MNGLVRASARERDTHGVLTLQVENDLFGAGTDKHYTHGTRLAYATPVLSSGFERKLKQAAGSIADLVPVFLENAPRRVSFIVGQSIFTPSDITRPNPDPTDRPYAGWLYVGAGVLADHTDAKGNRRLDAVKLDIGVVGPAALAEQAQTTVHELIGATIPRGWDYQLKNEPGIILTYERTWASSPEPLFPGVEIDLTPHLGAALGNVYTYGAFGGMVRVGDDLPSDYGPPRIRPGIQGSDFFVPGENFGWYVFVGGEGRLVLRNIFLDGNTFASSRSVDKLPMVVDIQVGVVFTFQRVRLALMNVLRSKEFESQKQIDEFGAITLSFRL